MTVLALRMAEDSIDSTFASTRCVSSSLWSPSGLFSHPADLGLTHQTTDPVTAVFLLYDHLTFGTVHRLAVCQELIQHLCGLPGCVVILRSYTEVVLVLLAVHSLVNSLAEDAVSLIADVTREFVDVIFEDAPAGAVGRFAVVTVLTARLCDVQPQFEKLLVLVLREK